MRTDSFVKIGLKRICIVGVLLELVHWLLQAHYPELSPHYLLHRELWVRMLMVAEYCVLMLATLLAVSHIRDAILTKTFREVNPGGLVLCVCLWVAFLYVYR